MKNTHVKTFCIPDSLLPLFKTQLAAGSQQSSSHDENAACALPVVIVYRS